MRRIVGTLDDINAWLSDFNGGYPKITSGGRSHEGGFTRWVYWGRGATYDYRTVFPNEAVFDIGDDGDWAACRRDSMRLWGRLDNLGVPHLRALSGGKGTHTHVFLPAPEYVAPFATWMTVRRPWGAPAITHDRLLVAPGVEKRMIREFGMKSGGKTKRVWAMRPEMLPADRDEAYRVCPPGLPSSVEIAERPPGQLMYEVNKCFPGPCPRSEDCLFVPDVCDACPASL